MHLLLERAYLPALEASVSGFAILASATGIGQSQPVPKEVADILADIEEIASSLKSVEIDPMVRDVATRHLDVLKTLLENLEAFGADATMSAYLDLVVRLRRAENSASPSSKKKIAQIWPKIEQWAGRLAIIEQAINSGAGILGQMEPLKGLLEYIPKV